MSLFNRKPKLSALGTAIETVRMAIEYARKSSVLDRNRVLCSCEVVLDHLYWCQVTLRIAVDIVSILEDPKQAPERMGNALISFKAAAIRARLHQSLPELRQAYKAVDTTVEGNA